MKNYDLMACAQTGSGKTAAFLLPIISSLVKKVTSGKLQTIRKRPGMGFFRASPLFLIILPTRELAIQIFNEARRVRPDVLVLLGEGMFTWTGSQLTDTSRLSCMIVHIQDSDPASRNLWRYGRRRAAWADIQRMWYLDCHSWKTGGYDGTRKRVTGACPPCCSGRSR